MNTANKPPSPGGCGSDRPYRGSGGSGSIRALQRRPRPFHARAYAAAVGLRRDHGTFFGISRPAGALGNSLGAVEQRAKGNLMHATALRGVARVRTSARPVLGTKMVLRHLQLAGVMGSEFSS